MKHANTTLLAAACAAILSFPPQASGNENLLDTEWRPWSDVPEAERAIWAALFKRMDGKDGGAFPEMTRLMDKTDLGSWYLGLAFMRIDEMDGRNVLAQGDPHLLASVRGILPRLLSHDKRHETRTLTRGIFYLAKKGDSRDFPLFETYLADPVFRQRQSEMSRDDQGEQRDLFAWLSIPYKILQHRVAGTNIVMGAFDRKLYPYFNISLEYDEYSHSTNDLRFIPSVANTGPQAAYVYEAFEQAHALGRRLGCDTPYSSVTNIAPELLTMRVWFDADGNAVCDVDLAKYGISVPELSMATNAPPPLEPPPTAVTSGTNAATPAEPSAAPAARSCPVGLAAAVAGILAALILLAVLRRKLSRR